MFDVNCVINNDQTIQPLRYISIVMLLKFFAATSFAMVYDSFAVTLSVKVEILQVKYIAKIFHEKRIKKFRKKFESQVHEPFSMFNRYLELTLCQMK